MTKEELQQERDYRDWEPEGQVEIRTRDTWDNDYPHGWYRNENNELEYWDDAVQSSDYMPCIIHKKYERWCKDGELHRDFDEPAAYGIKEPTCWYKNGKLHRDAGESSVFAEDEYGYPIIEYIKVDKGEDLPAVIFDDGTKQYYIEGELHRGNDLPAVEWSNGNKEWFNNGKRHRKDDLPAVVYANGSKGWFKNGKKHRDNYEPAIMHADGRCEWWIKGRRAKGKVLSIIKNKYPEHFL